MIDKCHTCLAPSVDSIVVAPKLLGCVYKGLQYGWEIKKFVDFAKGTMPNFTMWEVYGLQLAYCVLDDGHMQPAGLLQP